MGLSVWGMRVSIPEPAPQPAPASKQDLPGFPKKIHPFELLGRARSLTVRQNFRGFVAHGVESDGTVDLSTSKNSLRFSFQSDSGRGPQPLRQPGTLPTRRYCGVQHVTVTHEGIEAKPDNPRRACGSHPILDLGEPEHCSLEHLWRVARKKKKFSKKSSARVEYFMAHGGPAYRIAQKKKALVLSARDCRTELKGRSGRGSSP